jgi:hypothetical protein
VVIVAYSTIALTRSRIARAVILIAALLLVVFAAPALAATAKFTWKGPFKVDNSAGQSLDALACPSAGRCLAIDNAGSLVRFDPVSPSAPKPATIYAASGLSGIACPSATQCTAVNAATGFELTFDPSSTSALPAPQLKLDTASSSSEGNDGPGPIACPTTTLCVTADGQHQVIVFDPANPAAAPSTTKVALGSSSVGFLSISCASAAQCTAIDNSSAVTFNPAALGTLTPKTVENKGLLFRLACPTATQCTAVDQGGSEVTFNPQAPAPATPVKLDNEGFNPLFGLACPTATQCTAVSGGGRAVTFNPQSPGTPTAVVVDRSPGGNVVGQNTGIFDVSCGSVTSCTAVDGNGQELTFNPQSPGKPKLVRIDAGSPLLAISCPSTNQCSAVDQHSQLTFNPLKPKPTKPKSVLKDIGIGIAGLDCPTATQCTAVRADQQTTFNPRSFHMHKPQTIDPGSDEGIADVVCRSTHECVADDANGDAVTFDAVSGKILRKQITVEEGESQTALACESKTLCTSVDNDGMMLSFQPLTGKRIASAKIDAPVGLDAPSGDSNDELDGIACPTTKLCVAIDTLVNLVQFNPRSKHKATPKPLDKGHSLTGIACPTSSECIAVDAAGRALVGNVAAGTWTTETIAGATDLTAVSCPSKTECAAVDTAGDVFVGLQSGK